MVRTFLNLNKLNKLLLLILILICGLIIGFFNYKNQITEYFMFVNLKNVLIINQTEK